MTGSTGLSGQKKKIYAAPVGREKGTAQRLPARRRYQFTVLVIASAVGDKYPVYLVNPV